MRISTDFNCAVRMIFRALVGFKPSTVSSSTFSNASLVRKFTTGSIASRLDSNTSSKARSPRAAYAKSLFRTLGSVTGLLSPHGDR